MPAAPVSAPLWGLATQDNLQGQRVQESIADTSREQSLEPRAAFSRPNEPGAPAVPPASSSAAAADMP